MSAFPSCSPQTEAGNKSCIEVLRDQISVMKLRFSNENAPKRGDQKVHRIGLCHSDNTTPHICTALHTVWSGIVFTVCFYCVWPLMLNVCAALANG